MFQLQPLSIGRRRLNLATGPNNGPPLLLLHGVTRGWSDWSPLLGTLTPRWRVVALDFRGHGTSGHVGDEYRVVDYVQDALAVLHHAISDPAVVIGHSLGAMVAAAVAAEMPRTVRALVLEDPPFHTMGDRIGNTPLLDYFRQLAQLIAATNSVPDLAKQLAEVQINSSDGRQAQRLGNLRATTALRLMAAFLAQVDPKVLAPIIAGRWLDGYDVQAIVRSIRCPILLLQADAAAGGMLTDADAELIESGAADCLRERFPGVGHLIHWTDPAGMMRHVVAFLESLRTDEGSMVLPAGRIRAAGDETYRVDGHENRHRHDSHQARPVG